MARLPSSAVVCTPALSPSDEDASADPSDLDRPCSRLDPGSSVLRGAGEGSPDGGASPPGSSTSAGESFPAGRVLRVDKLSASTLSVLCGWWLRGGPSSTLPSDASCKRAASTHNGRKILKQLTYTTNRHGKAIVTLPSLPHSIIRTGPEHCDCGS
jgi:hypothetical protein